MRNPRDCCGQLLNNFEMFGRGKSSVLPAWMTTGGDSSESVFL